MRQTLVTESSSVQDKWMSSFDVRTQQEERQKNSQGMTHLKNASQPLFSLDLPVISCHKMLSLKYVFTLVCWK